MGAQLVIEVESSKTACAGAAAAYLLRRIAARAGCYAPGIQEHMFFDLTRLRNGRDLEAVTGWFAVNGGELARLGYRVLSRRVAFRTPGIVSWVAEGDGYRGAVLPTNGRKLYPDHIVVGGNHAVGVAAASNGEANGARVLVANPWPGHDAIAPDVLEPAHRDRNYAALVLYWSGHF